MHWLKVRPLDELGLSSLTESERGWGGLPLEQAPMDSACPPLPFDSSMGIPDMQAIFSRLQERVKQDAEHYRIGVYRQEAVAQKKSIRRLPSPTVRRVR